jgi:hypothetical protein
MNPTDSQSLTWGQFPSPTTTNNDQTGRSSAQQSVNISSLLRRLYTNFEQLSQVSQDRKSSANKGIPRQATNDPPKSGTMLASSYNNLYQDTSAFQDNYAVENVNVGRLMHKLFSIVNVVLFGSEEEGAISRKSLKEISDDLLGCRLLWDQNPEKDRYSRDFHRTINQIFNLSFQLLEYGKKLNQLKYFRVILGASVAVLALGKLMPHDFLSRLGTMASVVTLIAMFIFYGVLAYRFHRQVWGLGAQFSGAYTSFRDVPRSNSGRIVFSDPSIKS